MTLLLIIFCSFVGMTLALLATSRGVGVSPDSVYYLVSARNLLDGHGLSPSLPGTGPYKPLVHWPPLYPLTLAALGATGLDMLIAARWLSAGLYGATIALVGLMTRRLKAPVWLVLVATLAVALGVDMIRVHAMAWSEPPCIFFGLLGFLLLDLHIERPRRLLLMAAAGSLACAFLTRYAGFAYVAIGALSIVVFDKRRFRARIADLAAFAVVAGALAGAMLLRNILVGGSATARGIAFRPAVVPEQLVSGLETVTLWFLPKPIGLITKALLLGVVVIGAVAWHVWLRRRANEQEPAQTPRPLSALPGMLAMLIVAYLVLMIATVTVILPMPILDYRNLAPMFPAAVVLASWMVARGLRSARRVRLVRFASVTACVIFIAVYAARAVTMVADVRRTGLGFRQDVWVESDVMQHVRELPPDQPIYTNAPDAIYILTGRGSLFVPWTDARDTEFDALHDALEQRRSVIVYCSNMKRSQVTPADELAERLHLDVLVRASDGVIYELGRD